MPTGAQIFDQPSGDLRLDLSSRYTRMLGFVDIPVTGTSLFSSGTLRPVDPLQGYVTDSRFSLGDPFWLCADNAAIAAQVFSSGSSPGTPNWNTSVFTHPNVTVSGTTLRWWYDAGAQEVLNDPNYWFWGGVRLYYGIC